MTSRVAWGICTSHYFTLLNGVKQGGVLSPILFTIYIDQLLYDLKDSGYGCYVKNIFLGALSYADDITLVSPSIRGLNKMLKICEIFSVKFDITFNCKKSFCIKFGDPINTYEQVFLNSTKIRWVDQIRHLGNYIDLKMNDEIDCRYKKSVFIGHVNKLVVNFSHLQVPVLTRLFKTYCTSFYASQMWQINTVYFDKICTEWNKTVRRI